MGGHLSLRLCWLWLELGFGELRLAQLAAAAVAPAAPLAAAAADALATPALSVATMDGLRTKVGPRTGRGGAPTAKVAS